MVNEEVAEIVEEVKPTPEPPAKKPKVKMSVIFSAITSLSSYAVMIFAAPHISRTLGPDGVGQYSYGHSIVSYFALLVAFGFVNYATQRMARQRDDKAAFSRTFWSVILSRLLLCTVVGVIYMMLAGFGVFDSKVLKVVYLILGMTILTHALDLTFLFQSVEKFKLLAILTVAVRVAYLVLIYLFIRSPNDLALYTAMASGYLLLIAVIQWFFVPKTVLKPDFKTISIKKTIADAFFFFLPDLAISIFMLADRTMLGLVTNTTQVAYYEQSYKIIYAAIAVLFAASPVLLSRISYLHEHGQFEEIRKKSIQNAEFYFLVGLPETAGLYVVAPYFFTTFFGDDFVGCVQVAYFMIPLVMLMPISSHIGSIYYVPNKKMPLITGFFFGAAVVNVLVNLFLIPVMGAQGAALASSLCQLVLSGLFIGFSAKHLDYPSMLKTSIKPLIATAIMVGSLLLFNFFASPYLSYLWVTILDIAIGIVVYGLSVLLLREPMVMSVVRIILKKFKKKGS